MLAIGLAVVLPPGAGAPVAHAQNLLVGRGGDGGVNYGTSSDFGGYIGGGGGGGIGGGGAGGGGGGQGGGIGDGGSGGGLVAGTPGTGLGDGGAGGLGGKGGSRSLNVGGGGGGALGGGGGSAGAVGGAAGGSPGGPVVDINGNDVSGVSGGGGGGTYLSAPVTLSANRTYEFVGIGGGGGGAGALQPGAFGYGGAFIIDGATLTVTRSLLIGGSGGGASVTHSGGDGGNGTLRLTDGAKLDVDETLLIGGSHGGGGSGGGGTGIVWADPGSSINIAPSSGRLIIGGPGGGGAGTLNLFGNLSFGAGAGFLIGGNGTFNVGGETAGASASGNITGPGAVTNNGSINFNQTNGLTFTAIISGTGAVAQNSAATTILTGDNTYTGGTSITNGTLQIGSGGPTGSIAGNVADNGRLVFNRSGNVAFGGVISGTGIVSQVGPGTLALAGANTYSGGTEISGGTVRVAANDNLGAASGTLALANGATLATTGTFTMNRLVSLGAGGGNLDIASGTMLTMGSEISGSGGLTKSNTGTLTLSSVNTYAGGTNIKGGVLQISADNNLGGASGVLAFANGATLATTESFTINRAVTLGAGGGTLDIASGTTLTIGGMIGGSGGLTKSDAGALVLTNANTYTGVTTIGAGTLQLGDGVRNGSVSGDVVNNAVLVVNPASGTSIILPGAISGTGSVKQAGSGTTVLTGAGTHTGGTTISGGTLQLGNGGTSGSITGNIADYGTLAFNRSDVATVSGVISGAGGVSQIGSGVTILTAANTYGGPTGILAGGLQAGAENALSPNSFVTVASGAALNLNGFSQTLPGLTNAGTVDLGTGSRPGTLLTVHGNYVGQGGTIGLNAWLGGDGSASDRLVIDAGTASGRTLLDIRNIGGPGAETNGDGIMVVQSLHGGVTNTGADDATTFRLAHRVAAGAYEYALHANGATNTSDQNWYLRTIRLSPVPDGGGNSVSPPPGPSASPNSGDIKVPRPEIPANSAILPLAIQYGHAMLGSLDDRGNPLPAGTSASVYEERAVQYMSDLSRAPVRAIVRVPVAREIVRWVQSGWAQVIGGRGIHGENDYWRRGPRYDYTFGGIKAGLDIYAREQADGTLDKAGAYIGYGRISSDVRGLFRAYYGRKAGNVDMNAYTLGGYWTHLAASGWYTDAVVQGTWYTNTRAKSVLGETVSPDGFGIIGSLEGGYAFRLGSGWTLTPQAQIVYENVTLDNAHDSFGRYRFNGGNSLRGRLGARLGTAWAIAEGSNPRMASVWLKANIWQEFLGDARTLAVGFHGENALTARSALHGTWGEIGAGFNAQVSDHASLYATGNYRFSLDRKGSQGWDGRLGLNVKW